MNFTELHFTKIANGWVVQYTINVNVGNEKVGDVIKSKSDAMAFGDLASAVAWVNQQAVAAVQVAQ